MTRPAALPITRKSTLEEIKSPCVEIALDYNQTHALRDNGIKIITVLVGQAWITAEGHAGDYFLEQGQSWNSPNTGVVVVQGMSNGVNLVRVRGC